MAIEITGKVICKKKTPRKRSGKLDSFTFLVCYDAEILSLLHKYCIIIKYV